MPLSQDEIRRLGELARIRFDATEEANLLEKLNQVMDVIGQLRAVDTTGIVPMTHPQAGALRQREDRVTETDRREQNQRSAPAVANGLYLVPKVVE